MQDSPNRREFLKATGAALVAGGVGSMGSAQGGKGPGDTPLPTRLLGKNGGPVSILGLGGEHALSTPDNHAVAVPIVEKAIELGVTYYDTAQIYWPSEEYIGEAIKGIPRESLHISSKADPRDPEESKRLLERSLKALGTDYLDNLHIHRVRNEEDIQRLVKKGGLLDLLRDAKEQGIARQIGITGHFLSEALEGILKYEDFDNILLPVNPTDDHYKSFRPARNAARDRGMGIIAMKISARGRLIRECGVEGIEPLLRYALSQDVDCAIVGVSTLEELKEDVRVVKNFQPMTQLEQIQLEERLRPHTLVGTFYKQNSGGWID